MPRGLRDSLSTRYRWSVALAAAIAGVSLTILLYRATEPRPTSTFGIDIASLPEGATTRVGALPVT